MASQNEPPPPYTTTENPEHEAALLAETTAWIPDTPIIPQARTAKLLKPVVIPRVDTVGHISERLPFVRAYSPDLRHLGVLEAEFVAFVDNLAVCQAAPVPLKALNKAGMAVGFFPGVIPMAVSAGMGVVAGIGTTAIIIVRTRRFMEKVNREYFAPRGLKVSICKNDELVRKLRYNPREPELAPLNDPAAVPDSLRERRMTMLAPYIAPLSLDVPPPSAQRNAIDQMSAKAIERRLQSRQKKQQKKAEKLGLKHGQEQASSAYNNAETSSSSDSSASFDNTPSRQNPKVERKLQKINSKAERDLSSKDAGKAAKIEEKRIRKIDRVERKGERKQEKASAKESSKFKKLEEKDKAKVTRMEFLLVENLDSI